VFFLTENFHLRESDIRLIGLAFSFSTTIGLG
jgi:hypothetical protein